jgi:hypothetical protein
VNLATYWGRILQFWAVLPTWMSSENVRWSLSHAFLVALVGYHLIRRRRGIVAFGLLYFGVALAPTLPLKNHTYYLHTYIPAPGILLLVAFAIDDVVRIPFMFSSSRRRAFLGAAFVLASLMSFAMIRENENLPSELNPEVKRSFVLRRALIAKATFESVSQYKPFDPSIERVLFVYGRPEGRDVAKWNMNNVVAAVGGGALFNLVYEKPNLEVRLQVDGDPVSSQDVENADVYYYDDAGNAKRFTELFRK